LIVVLKPLGEIDNSRRHQHDSRLLRHLAVKLIEFLRQLVAISGVQKRPSNVAAEQIVARIKLIRHGASSAPG